MLKAVWTGAAAAAVVAAAWMLRDSRQRSPAPDATETASSAAPATPAATPASGEPVGDGLPPLPYWPYPTPRPVEVVRSAYEFAARHPEVLRYVPCFCGCEQSGHESNDDCFVASRDAGGRVTWDVHGLG